MGNGCYQSAITYSSRAIDYQIVQQLTSSSNGISIFNPLGEYDNDLSPLEPDLWFLALVTLGQ